MDQQKIVAKLFEWMGTFVEVPNPALGNWPPCPYARQARVNNTIGFVFTEVSDFRDAVQQSIDLLESKEVVIIFFDHRYIDPVTLQEWVTSVNNQLMLTDHVILEDHPDAPEYVSGVKMNFGECGLLVVQKLSKLNIASAHLRSKGYYDHWDQAALDDVVNWRFN